jgi:hypothetical protein
VYSSADPRRKKSGDFLFFVLKQCMALEKVYKSWVVPKHWLNGIKKLADAFVKLWNKYGQLGQIIDIETRDLLIGGSSAGAIVPAGLALASEYLNCDYRICLCKCSKQA